MQENSQIILKSCWLTYKLVHIHLGNIFIATASAMPEGENNAYSFFFLI